MNQSSTIAGFLLIGFLVYITVNGELTSYKSVLFGSPNDSSSASGFGSPASQNNPIDEITKPLDIIGGIGELF